MLYLKSLTLILSPLKFLIKTESSHLPPHSPLPCTANFPYLVSPAFHHSQLPISWQHLVTWPISDNVSNRISELRLAQRSTFRGSWLLNVIFIRLQQWPKCQHPCVQICVSKLMSYGRWPQKSPAKSILWQPPVWAYWSLRCLNVEWILGKKWLNNALPSLMKPSTGPCPKSYKLLMNVLDMQQGRWALGKIPQKPLNTEKFTCAK